MKEEANLRRTWYKLTFRGILLFLLGVLIIGIHMLIDYGLDFEDVRRRSSSQKPYEMLEFVPTKDFEQIRTEYVPAKDKRTEYANQYCEEAGLLPNLQVCDTHVGNLLTYCNERFREAFMLTRRLLESSTLDQLDMFNRIFFSYGIYKRGESVAASGNTCRMKEQRKVLSFDGQIELEAEEECEHGEMTAWLLDIGTRVTQVSEKVPIRAPDALVKRVSSETKILDLHNYLNMKDDLQNITLYDVTRDDHRSQQGEKLFARIDAEPDIRYVKETDQQAVLLDLELARIANGKEEHVLHNLGELRISWPLRSSAVIYCNPFEDGDAGFMYNIDLIGPDGQTCNPEQYQVQFRGITCVQHGREIGGTTVQIAMTSLRSMLLFARDEGKESIFQTEDRCVKQVGEAFIDELTYLEDDYEFALAAALEIQIVCATVEEELQTKCIGGPGKYWFDGEDWIDVSNESESTKETWTTHSEIKWIAAQLVNVEKSVAREILANVKPFVQTWFKFMFTKVSFNVMRVSIVGIRMNWGMKVVFAGLGTQMRATTRDLYVLNPQQNTVLRVEYLIGIGLVLIITFLGFIVAFVYYIREEKAYYDLGLIAKVPWTTTEWIAAYLPYVDGSKGKGNILLRQVSRKLMDDLECAAEEKLSAEETALADAKLGFLEPVLAQDDESSGISNNSTSWG